MTILGNKREQDFDKEENIGDVFEKGFQIVCRCSSRNISVVWESGSMGSEYTGYMEGTFQLKCRKCGNCFVRDI